MQLRMQTREFLHKFPRESQEALYIHKKRVDTHPFNFRGSGWKKKDRIAIKWIGSLCAGTESE